MDIIGIIIGVLGGMALVLAVPIYLDDDSVSAVIMGVIGISLIFFGFGVNMIRMGILNDIDKWTVTKIELVNVKEKIYRVSGIKDPGIFFTNRVSDKYTLIPPEIGQEIDK